MQQKKIHSILKHYNEQQATFLPQTLSLHSKGHEYSWFCAWLFTFRILNVSTLLSDIFPRKTTTNQGNKATDVQLGKPIILFGLLTGV